MFVRPFSDSEVWRYRGKNHGSDLELAEMKMLRFSSPVLGMDRITENRV